MRECVCVCVSVCVCECEFTCQFNVHSSEVHLENGGIVNLKPTFENTTWLLVRQEVFDLWHSDRKQTRTQTPNPGLILPTWC